MGEPNWLPCPSKTRVAQPGKACWNPSSLLAPTFKDEAREGFANRTKTDGYVPLQESTLKETMCVSELGIEVIMDARLRWHEILDVWSLVKGFGPVGEEDGNLGRIMKITHSVQK